jgi:glycosyltransferase involved in cell wall biosynthesis
VLAGLGAQTLPTREWQICVVDNGSSPALQAADFAPMENLRVVREDEAGLLAARLCGLRHTTSPYLVFIDDDTVPSPGFLAAAVAFMESHPRVATAGGKIIPRYLAPPPPWIGCVAWILALRDNGDAELEWSIADAGTLLPHWTPIGAGLLVRRACLVPGYIRHVERHRAEIGRISWRGQGAGGVEDKDLVLHSLRAGYSTGYVPGMILEHIIPAERLTLPYFEKLIPAVQKMWAQTLEAHGFAPRGPIHPATLGLRKAKAWWSFRAWRSPAHRLQWLESCGYLDGLAANYRHSVRYDIPPTS